MMEWLENLPNMFRVLVSDFGFIDLLDILIVAWILYLVMTRLHTTSAARIAKGVVLLLLATWVTDLASLDVLHFLLSTAIEMGFLALIIVFQPEIRRFLERFGSKNLRGLIATQKPEEAMEQAIHATVVACESMSAERTGALIVFEREEALNEFFRTGTVVDANVSTQLLKNLFFNKAALHDGAVIVQNGRIAAAGCVLPLSESPNLNRDLGTRHRASIGISEATDALAVVVSEETGVISVAAHGTLRRHLAGPMLEKILREELLPKEDELAASLPKRLIDRLQVKKHERKQKNKP